MDLFLRRSLDVIDEHGGVSIESVLRAGDNLTLNVRVVDSEGVGEPWILTARHDRAHRIELGWTDVLTFGRKDHPLLWPHVGEQAKLFFSGRPRDPAGTVGRLYERHQRETESWHPFERFLNPEMRVGPLLDAGAGLLASGPVRLLTAYADELATEGVPFSIEGNRPAKYWKPLSPMSMAAGEWIPEDKPLAVLTLGDSYVIAGRFVATR